MNVATPSATQESLENRYYAFLRAQGYSSEAALVDVLRDYLPYFAGKQNIADLGCGHGEFLALLRDAGHDVAGVDIDPGMVEMARTQGFDVELGDAVAWLRARPGTFDGVFSSNVVEHLPATVVVEWIAAAYVALKPGGVLLFATPNPESVIVQLHEFWRDATHVRMYGRQLLEFLLVDGGFTQVKSGESKGARWDGMEKLLEGVGDAVPAIPLPPEVPAPVADPVAPPADASFGARLKWRVNAFVHAKFVEGWTQPLRVSVQRQTEQLEAQRTALLATQDQFLQVQQRLQRLVAADTFLYPSREIWVTGVKPDENSDHIAHTTVQTPEAESA